MEKWATTQTTLLALEKSEDSEDTARLLATTPAKELQQRGLLLTKLRIGSLRTGLGGRSLVELEASSGGDENLAAHRMRAGDLVAIEVDKHGAAKSGGGKDKSEAETLRVDAVVYRVQDKRVIVSVDGAVPDDLLDRIVRLVKLSNDLPYKRMLAAVEQVRAGTAANPALLEVIFQSRKPGFNQPVPTPFKLFNTSLNRSQTEAIQFAMSADELALIHGPPGTGKTTTLIELMRQLLARGGSKTRILACGPSNISVDNMVERLAQTNVTVLRLGHPARVLPSILDVTLDSVTKTSDAGNLVNDIRKEMDNVFRALADGRNRSKRRELYGEIKTLRKELRQREEQAFRVALDTAQVICCTLSGAASTKLRDMQFDYVCIDEVSQSLEAECWIAAVKGKRLILCGDPLQLPPTIKSSKAASDGLETTLFERLQKKHGDAVVRMLTIQYRMNDLISRWTSKELYKNRLVADPAVAARVLTDLPDVKASADDTFASSPLFLIDTAGCNLYESVGDDGDSKYNEGEAMVAEQHVKALVSIGVAPMDIAVITPYNAQVQLLQSRLKATFPELEIGSVDGFQGREKEAVVLSLVRSNEDGEVGFLKEDRRLNVAVTRAKRHVALICDTTTMEKHKFLNRLCEHFTEHGEVTSAEMYDLSSS